MKQYTSIDLNSFICIAFFFLNYKKLTWYKLMSDGPLTHFINHRQQQLLDVLS